MARDLGELADELHGVFAPGAERALRRGEGQDQFRSRRHPTDVKAGDRSAALSCRAPVRRLMISVVGGLNAGSAESSDRGWRMTGLLLTIAFLASGTIALSHIVNRRFVAPTYDCALNLVAFSCQAGVAVLLEAWAALAVSSLGIGCWIALTVRTVRALAAR